MTSQKKGFWPARLLEEQWWWPTLRNPVDPNDTCTEENSIDESSEPKEKAIISANIEVKEVDSGNTHYADDMKHEIVEYRDEANRPWYKFFDEYEYRIPKKVSSGHRWYHWFDENDTPAERKLILKLDIILCFFSVVVYWVKYLDQSNLNNAYVNGMKTTLDMKGNDLVITQAMYTAGSIIFQIPFMYIFCKYPSHKFLPLMDLGWGLFTLVTYRSNSTAQLKGFRFMVGVFESAVYPAFHYLFGSWYKPSEINRRGGIYYFGQMLGVITAGLLQSAAHRNLDGVNGLEGWRWMFIIDAVITLPVAVIGFFLLPGTPSQCYSIVLTDEEILLARKRMRENNVGEVDPTSAFFDKKLWKKIVTSWQIYALVLWEIFLWNNSNSSSGSYILWLKSLDRFSPGRLQNISAITPAFGILWIFLICFYADLFRSRWQAITIAQMLNIIGNVILAVWYVPEHAKWFAFMLQYFGWAIAPVLYGWHNDINRHDARVRAVIGVVMNMLGQTFAAWISVLVWKTVEAPRYLKGYSWTAVSAFCLILTTFVILFFYKRDERRKARENGIYVYNSRTGENMPEIFKEIENELAFKSFASVDKSS
ncbi:MFS general substrate transporter [Nadsonia fulvescens var. elongata DSM 6958]|uniref:MFS general substrate transporter n=1 Tax=Nadsonia fulvescens var. elongata DSM 6958 TaxID=857566 RepID=A0A1E3PTM8_9ASCO|nr:MFS general substrate transporter [Nadsonia fulvescens var. elongata DSM 6958]